VFRCPRQGDRSRRRDADRDRRLLGRPVEPGDFILNHVGFAIRRIPPEEAAETLALYDELLRLADEQDLMTADVRAEIEAAPDAVRVQKGAGDESE